MSRCRSCGRPITWTVSPLGHRMPVNTAPVNDGNLHLDRTTTPPTVTVVIGTDHEPDCPGPHYLSHFATCQQAAEWRR